MKRSLSLSLASEEMQALIDFLDMLFGSAQTSRLAIALCFALLLVGFGFAIALEQVAFQGIENNVLVGVVIGVCGVAIGVLSIRMKMKDDGA